MKVIYERAIEINNDLKFNVDEQQDDIKHLKEECDMGDEDKNQEISAARNPMKKNIGCVRDMQSNICNENWVEQKYPGRAH